MALTNNLELKSDKFGSEPVFIENILELRNR